jgi:osmotically-inducible protein OsmY
MTLEASMATELREGNGDLGRRRASPALLAAVTIGALGLCCRGHRESAPLPTAGAPLPEVPSRVQAAAQPSWPDEQVTSAVGQAVAHALGPTEGRKVSVSVEHGVVLLSGATDSSNAKQAALAAAVATPGVRSVVDQMSVVVPTGSSPSAEATRAAAPGGPRPPEVPGATDDAIASAVRDALYYDPRISRSDVSVRVARGVVTLRGDPSTLLEKRAAVEDAQHTVGVVRVEDLLRVAQRSPASDDEIALKVRLAFDHDPIVDLRNLDLTASGGQVLIHGRVGGELAHARALAIASAVPGVVSVGDGVVVTPRVHEGRLAPSSRRAP